MIFTKNNNKFGNRIRELRLQAGLTQAQLADKLNISASTVGMYEQGRREPDNQILTQLCHELQVSVDYLLGAIEPSLKNTNSEIDSLILDFIDFLEAKNNLTFNGEPLSDANKKRITSALRIATAVVMAEISKDPYGIYKGILIRL